MSRAPIALHSGQVTDLHFYPATERLLAVLSTEREHKLVSLDLAQASPEPEQLYSGNQTITGVAVSRHGGLYVVALRDGDRPSSEFKLFARGAGRRCGDIWNSPILAIRFSADGRRLALATGSGRIYVVDTADCNTRQFYYQESQDVAFDASGQFLIAIMADSTTSEWDLSLGVPERRPLQVLTAPVNGYLHKLSFDAAYLASQDGTDVLLTNVSERRNLFQLIREGDNLIEEEDLRFQLGLLKPLRLTGHAGAPQFLQFSADNSMLATADAQGKVMVWDVKGAPLVERAASDEKAEAVVASEAAEKEAVSPNGQITATVSEQSSGCEDAVLAPGCELKTTLTLQSRATHEVIGSLEDVTQRAIPRETLANRFTPDGDLVTLASDSNEPLARYYTWHIEPAALRDRACRRANRPLGPGDSEIQGLVQGWRTWLVGEACAARAR